MSQTSAPLLILIDGSSYLYRAFHALPPLSSPQGEPTGALYGVVNMIKKLLNDYPSEHVAVIFDTKGETFRDALYGDYKANRDAMPDDLALQIEPLHEMIRAMGLPLLTVEQVEADDVIGTLSQQAQERGWNVLISTGDKDMAQLVSDKVTLINTMTNTRLDPTGVLNKFGIPPERIIDYLTLVGDTSDNIPGVPGVGPKTALKWLAQYGDLQNIITHHQEIGGKVGERLAQTLSDLPLYKQLVTIKQDVALPVRLEDLTRQAPNLPVLRQLYERFDFKNWLKQLGNKADNPTPLAAFELIQHPKELNEALVTLKEAESLVLYGLIEYHDHETLLHGLGVGLPKKQFYFIPFQHPSTPTLGRTSVLAYLKPLLENPSCKKIGYDLKNLKNALVNYAIHLHGISDDILIQNSLLHGTQDKPTLEKLAERDLQQVLPNLSDLLGKGSKKVSLNTLPLETLGHFIQAQLQAISGLQSLYTQALADIPTLETAYETIERPLITTLSHMETRGVLIDSHLLHAQSESLGARLQTLEEEVYRLSNKVFNLSSPKQLQEVLYDELKLPILAKTSTGQASTAEEVLQALAHDYPIPKLILEYRTLSKLKSTYTDALPKQVNPSTGRIHTHYHQTGTSTGRLSSSDPNLQNIPIRNEEGRQIRLAFIAEPEHCLISADYSQIELRLMAHFSKDPKLLAAFSDGQDIHRATAAEVLGIANEAVTAEQRRQAKVINFGILYGMSAFGLAKELQLPREAAQAYIDRYFQRYPGVQDYMESVRHFAHQHGYVETLYGRRIYIPDIHNKQFQKQKAAERAAINGPLQGTAADMIKIAMNRLDEALQNDNKKAYLTMQVHDELVIEAPEAECDYFTNKLKEAMVEVIKLDVPLLVDIHSGKNWDEAH